ncbi:MAG: PAS domain-containing protein [Actinomycetaceae bacterium]|nr:PAS domain-containing protein [Actinomycetaceae bacterium]
MSTPAQRVPINEERFFGKEEIIVSKTDLKGVITYANDVFCKAAGYEPEQLLGQPHSLIRHPDMPRGVFKLLWMTIEAGNEIFAYVKNMASDGRFYWVLAHVTPTFDKSGRIISYHSNRRCPARKAIEAIEPVYKIMLDVEKDYKNPNEASEASVAAVVELLTSQGKDYNQFIWEIINGMKD